MRILTNFQVFSLTVLVLILVFYPITNAKQIFYNSLDSQKSVQDGGGKVHGGTFVEGAMGKGFYSKAAGEAVSFPTEEKLLLEAGTIALWVKVMIDIKKVPGESFIFMMYKRGGDALFINHSHNWGANQAICWMIKHKGKWFENGIGKSCSKPLKWETGETHFITTTWGPKGMHLFLDGKSVGKGDHKTGPSLMDDDFWVGNIEIEKGCTLPSQWVQDELYIFDTQLGQAEVTNLMKSSLAVQPSATQLALTWGMMKLKR